MLTRDEAYALLTKYNESEALVTHALAVEAVMRYFARQFDEDADYWGAVGIIHDLDYEKYPEEHCHKTKEILEAEGVDEDIIQAVISHGWNICIDVEPTRYMEKSSLHHRRADRVDSCCRIDATQQKHYGSGC